MSEIYLAIAARDRLRAHALLDESHVDCEWDEMAPAVVPDYYIVVTTAGVTPGPTQDSSGTIWDSVYGLDVIVILRAPKKPRDRQRELWIETTRSFYQYQKAIRDQLDFDYTTLTNANDSMIAAGEAQDNGCELFIEPLRWNGDGPIRPGSHGLFAGRANEPIAALVRTIRYRGARRLVARS